MLYPLVSRQLPPRHVEAAAAKQNSLIGTHHRGNSGQAQISAETFLQYSAVLELRFLAHH
jgi:hypothetical protein